MTHSRAVPLAIAGVVTAALLAACSKGDGGSAGATGAAAAATPSASTSEQANEDLQDITRYELSMDQIDKFYAAQRNIMLKAKALSPAERERMEAKGEINNNDASIDDMVRKVEDNALTRDAVRDAGLSPREYTMVTMALMQASMGAAVMKMRPKDNQDSLAREMKANPANIRFVMQNEKALGEKQAKFAAEMKALGIENDG